MTSEATIEDFKVEVGRLVEVARASLQNENMTIQRKAAAAGQHGGSSQVYIMMREAVDQVHDRTVDQIVNELQNFALRTSVSAGDLREVALEAFSKLGSYLGAQGLVRYGELLRNKQMVGAGADHSTEMKDRALSRLRRFDIGMWPQPMKEPAAVSNIINATNINGPVQQGATGSAQTVQTTIDARFMLELIQKLEEELPADSTVAVIEDLRSEMDTLKAQLRKSVPSRSVLRAVGESMVSVAENIGAAVLTPSAIGAAHALGSVLTAI